MSTETRVAGRQWGDVPPNQFALREKLPQFRPETRQRLLDWGMGQMPAVGAWVMCRAALYYGAGHAARLNDLDAVACLDLLVWQSGRGDAEAIAGLPVVDGEK